METIIVSGILLVIVGLVIRKMIRDRKNGRGVCSCGGDCSACKGCR